MLAGSLHHTDSHRTDDLYIIRDARGGQAACFSSITSIAIVAIFPRMAAAGSHERRGAHLPAWGDPSAARSSAAPVPSRNPITVPPAQGGDLRRCSQLHPPTEAEAAAGAASPPRSAPPTRWGPARSRWRASRRSPARSPPGSAAGATCAACSPARRRPPLPRRRPAARGAERRCAGAGGRRDRRGALRPRRRRPHPRRRPPRRDHRGRRPAPRLASTLKQRHHAAEAAAASEPARLALPRPPRWRRG